MTIQCTEKRFLLYMVSAMLGLTLFFLTDNIGPWRFSVVYWLIGLPFLRYLQTKYDDLLHPAGPLVILTFLYSISSVIVYYSNGGLTKYDDVISSNSFMAFCVACVLGELGIVFGVILAARQQAKKTTSGVPLPDLVKASSPVIYALAALLAILSFGNIVSAFDFLHAKSYSETAMSNRVEILEGAATMPISQVLTSDLPIGLLIAAGILLTFQKRIGWKLVGGGILAANLFTCLLSGARGLMFTALCSITVFIHYRIKRFKMAAIILGVLVSLFLLNGISLVRSTAKLDEMMDIFVTHTGGNIIPLISLSNNGELIVGMNLMKLIEAIASGESSFNFGKGFVDDILCYVPRVLYPNRPLPLSERFVEDFYPGVRDKGGGYGLFFLQDGYWAFGLLGVFLSLTAYSWALSRIYLYIKNYFDSDFIVLVYAAMYFPLVICSPRSGLLLSFKIATMSILPFLLVLSVTYMRRALGRNRANKAEK